MPGMAPRLAIECTTAGAKLLRRREGLCEYCQAAEASERKMLPAIFSRLRRHHWRWGRCPNRFAVPSILCQLTTARRAAIATRPAAQWQLPATGSGKKI
jgi:hypothetical protein